LGVAREDIFCRGMSGSHSKACQDILPKVFGVFLQAFTVKAAALS
jgi:hypothetical protein